MRAVQHPGGRPGLLAIVIVLWVMIAAIVLTGTLIVAFSQSHPARFAAPLKIYPVAQQLPGQCPVGTQGIVDQSATGVVCYQLTTGITIRQVSDIHVEPLRTEGGYAVSISLNPADGRALKRLTERSAGRPFALTVRDRVVAAPRVDAPITEGHVLISGHFTRQQANQIVDRLKGRTMPVPPPATAPASPPAPSPTANQPATPTVPSVTSTSSPSSSLSASPSASSPAASSTSPPA